MIIIEFFFEFLKSCWYSGISLILFTENKQLENALLTSPLGTKTTLHQSACLSPLE